MGNMELGHGPEGSGPEGGSRRVQIKHEWTQPQQIKHLRRRLSKAHEENAALRVEMARLRAVLMDDEPVGVPLVNTVNQGRSVVLDGRTGEVRPCDVFAAVLEGVSE